MSMSPRVFPGIPFDESPLFEAELSQSDLQPWERDIAIDLSIARLRCSRLSRSAGWRKDRQNPCPPCAHVRPCGGRIGDTASLAGIVQDAWQTDEDVRAIASEPRILDLLTKLYGRRAFPFQMLTSTSARCTMDSVHFSSIPGALHVAHGWLLRKMLVSIWGR